MVSLIAWIKKLFNLTSAFNKADAVLAGGSAGAVNVGIIAARVATITKHPNADRLRVVSLETGKNRIEPVVCGAFNFEVGDMVALALPGAEISKNIHSESHEPFVLEKAKIRGIESQGMICAAFELGLSDDPGKGIALLKSSVEPGSQFRPEMIE